MNLIIKGVLEQLQAHVKHFVEQKRSSDLTSPPVTNIIKIQNCDMCTHVHFKGFLGFQRICALFFVASRLWSESLIKGLAVRCLFWCGMTSVSEKTHYFESMAWMTRNLLVYLEQTKHNDIWAFSSSRWRRLRWLDGDGRCEKSFYMQISVNWKISCFIQCLKLQEFLTDVLFSQVMSKQRNILAKITSEVQYIVI